MTNPTKRSFWFSAGLVGALAASIGLSGVGTQAAPGDDESTFVPITPCRLFDFRQPPDQVGPRSTPLDAGEIHLLQVTGSNGQCTIPVEAVGVAMNVTALNATAPSFLQAWPADAPQPVRGSSLNYLPGQQPTPNKVDVKLSADGSVNLYNLAGTVDVLGDIVGYYTDDGLQDIVSELGNKADIVDVYNKQETLDLLDDLPAVADVYKTGQTFNRTEITNLIIDAVTTKADAVDIDAIEDDVATLQTDVTGLTDDVAAKADATNVYPKADTYSQAEVDGLLSDVATLSQVYDRSEQEALFQGRDPDLAMRQATGELRGPLGLLPLSVAGVTLDAETTGLMELAGPSALTDAFGGTVDYELTALDVCIDDFVGAAFLDTVTVSVRDDLGVITEFTDTTDRTVAGCSTVDVTSVANPQAYFVEVSAGGPVGTSIGITGIETTFEAATGP